MTDAEIVVGVRGDISGGKVVKRTLDDIADSGGKAKGATEAYERSMRSADAAANSLSNALRALAATFSVRELIRYADTWSDISSRVRIATGSIEQGTVVMERLSVIADRTYSSLTQTAETYLLNATAMREMGYSTKETLDWVETINNALVVSAAKGQRAESVMNALSKAMALGKLSGDELNTVISTGGRVAQALAESMGVSTRELRKLGQEGKITTKDIVEIKSQLEKLRAEADSMPATISDAFTRIGNAAMRTIGVFDQTNRVSGALAENLVWVAKNMDMVAKAITGAAILAFARLTSTMSANVASIVAQAVAWRANAAAAAETAAEALKVAAINRAGAIAALQMAQANRVATGSYTMVASAARAAQVAQAQYTAAQAASVAATASTATAMIGLRTAAAGVLAVFGGIPGILIAASTALWVFWDDISDFIRGVKPFGDEIATLGDYMDVVFERIANSLRAWREELRGILDFLGNVGQKLGLNNGPQTPSTPSVLASVNTGNVEGYLGDFFSKNEAFLNRGKSGLTIAANKRAAARIAAEELERDVQAVVDEILMGEKGGNGKPPAGDSSARDKELKAIQSTLDSLVNSTRTWQEEIAELERLRPFAKTQEQLTAIDRAIDKIRRDVEKNSPTYKAFESFAKGIDDGFRDAFRNAFTQSEGGFKGMLEGLKSSFKTFLADLAYMAIARPIMLNIVAGIGGSLGLSSGGISDILGGSGTNMLGGIGNLFSAGRSLLSGGNLFGVNSTLGLRVNQLGGLLGIDNLSSLSSFTNGSFGGTLGAGLGGFGGNMLANALFGDRGIGSNIGGTLGAIAGSFIPVPILGPAIGSFLGNAIGGLFGNKSISASSQYGGLDLSSLETFGVGGQTGKKFSKANADARDKLLQQAADYAQLLKNAGATLSGEIFLRVSDKPYHGLGVGMTQNGEKLPADETQWYSRKKPEEYMAAVYKMITENAEGLTGTIKTIIDKVGFSNATALTDALNFGILYDQMVSTLDTVDPLQVAIDALNKQFDELRKKAAEYGLSVEKLNEVYEKQKETITASIKAQQAGFSNLEAMTKAFNDFLNGQALGSNSSLSPMGKLELAQGNFGDLLAKAQGGDLSVTQDLLKAANDLLSMGRSVYASSVSFAGLESFVRSSITEIARAAGVPGYASGADAVAGGLSMVGEQGPELRRLGRGDRVWSAGETAGIMALSGNVASDLARSNAQMIALSSQMLEETREMRKELRQMRKQTERSANRKAVAGA